MNVAVLEGDQVKVIDENASTLPDCPALLTSLLGFDVRDATAHRTATLLVPLAVSMRAHGRGGSLLVVPSDSVQWRDSIVTPDFVRRSTRRSPSSGTCHAHSRPGPRNARGRTRLTRRSPRWRA